MSGGEGGFYEELRVLQEKYPVEYEEFIAVQNGALNNQNGGNSGGGSSAVIGTLVLLPSELETAGLIEETQEQPREEVEIVQETKEDDEVIGDVVDQLDNAVMLNPQNTMQQIQAVLSHLSAGMHLSYLSYVRLMHPCCSFLIVLYVSPIFLCFFCRNFFHGSSTQYVSKYIATILLSFSPVLLTFSSTYIPLFPSVLLPFWRH